MIVKGDPEKPLFWLLPLLLPLLLDGIEQRLTLVNRAEQVTKLAFTVETDKNDTVKAKTKAKNSVFFITAQY